MCGGLKQHQVKVRPGSQVKYRTSSGERIGVWGLGQGLGAYNARIEKMDTTWKSIKDNRAVVVVDSFDEKGANFKRKDGLTLLAAMHDFTGDFVILTCEAQGVVKEFHHRMPVIINNEKEWLDEGMVGDTPVIELLTFAPRPEGDRHRQWLKSL